MIQSYTRLKVADNSGAREVMCIRTPVSSKKAAAKVGDILTGVVKDALPHSSVKRKELVKALIVRQRKPLKRPDGTTISFDDNAVVLINPDHTLRGTRIFGPVARELRDKGFMKVVSMATEVL